MIQAQIKELAKDIRDNPDRFQTAMEDNPELARGMLFFLNLALPIIASTPINMENAEVFDNLLSAVKKLLLTQAGKILEQAENDRMQERVEHRDSYNEMVKREVFREG